MLLCSAGNAEDLFDSVGVAGSTKKAAGKTQGPGALLR